MVLNDTRTHVQSSWKVCNLRIRNGSEHTKRRCVSEAKMLGIPKTRKKGYKSISADHAVTAIISFRCLKAKKKNKMTIHPISGHSP
jgi:hypothetical protein